LTVANAPLGPVLGAGAYVLTAPSIHLGHHRPLAALGSISLRIAAPLALNALVEKGPCGPDPCLGPGFFAGMALASLVDVTLLAHDSGEPTPKKTERVTPTVAAGPKSTALFLTGSF
jgi:hypothetical protein